MQAAVAAFVMEFFIVLPEKLLNEGILWYKYLHGHFAQV